MADVAEADSQLSAHLQGLLFQGQGCDQAPGESLGRLERREVLRVDAVIAGSVEKSDKTGPGSADNALGTDREVARAVNHCHAAQLPWLTVTQTRV